MQIGTPFLSLHVACVLLLICSYGPLSCAEETAQPNIVILLADDLGWKDVGYHGGNIQTPNLDRLAQLGIRLENWHAAPLCSPTRAGLMTGRWPIRYGMGESVITPWRRWGLPTSERTLADELALAGYQQRGIVGKWHLGHFERKYLPLHRGFTSFYGHYNGALDYFSHVREGQLDWHRNEDTCQDAGYSTDLIGAEAVRFIRTCPSDEPYLLYVPFNAPHTPLQAKPEDIQKYADMSNAKRQKYAAMVDSMDQAIGSILSAIDQRGDREDTLIWFFSDNGGVSFGDNRPWRGGKGSVYEGGVRTPAIVHWPAGNLQGGSQIDGMLGMIDVLPTLRRIAKLETPQTLPCDGIDILDILRGQAEAPVRDWFSYIAQGRAPQMALCDGTWKLVVTQGEVLDVDLSQEQTRPRVELFRLDRDPGETRNLATKQRDVAAAMLAKMQDFRRLKLNNIPNYDAGRNEFQAPRDWKITD